MNRGETAADASHLRLPAIASSDRSDRTGLDAARGQQVRHALLDGRRVVDGEGVDSTDPRAARGRSSRGDRDEVGPELRENARDLRTGVLVVARNRENANNADTYAEQRQRRAEPMNTDCLPRRGEAQQNR